jgi:hypothetical protein
LAKVLNRATESANIDLSTLNFELLEVRILWRGGSGEIIGKRAIVRLQEGTFGMNDAKC